MSRSRKKNPVHGIAVCRSDKPWKVKLHRRQRVAAQRALELDPEDPAIKSLVRGDSEWDMGKDGKRWWGTIPPPAAKGNPDHWFYRLRRK